MDSHYVDVHTHLTHKQFDDDCSAVIQRAQNAGLGAIVLNGLEPISNRQTLNLAEQHEIILPALGIYPVDAAHPVLEAASLPYSIKPFSIAQEIAFIEAQAKSGKIVAIGECGLDGHWLDSSADKQQESVFCQLIDIAIRHNLPVIVHSRKKEKRCIEILENLGAKKVDFHCFGGRSKLAAQTAEKYGWHFSIPANCRRADSFRKMLEILPLELILTETDAPYLPPEKGARNEPANVVITIELLAERRSLSIEQARSAVWNNFTNLFSRPRDDSKVFAK